MFIIFGSMGFLWTFLWMVTYRELNYSIGIGNNGGDEESFIPSPPKVFILFKRIIRIKILLIR